MEETGKNIKENLDGGLNWGLTNLKILGEKISSLQIGEKIAETTTSISESLSQTFQNIKQQ